MRRAAKIRVEPYTAQIIWVSYKEWSKVKDFHFITKVGVKTGFNGSVMVFFIANPLTNARNGPMRFESGSRLFGNRIFEHPRPRNEPGKTKPRSPGIRNDGRSSRNSLESILRPKTPLTNSKKNANPRKFRKSRKSHYLAVANPDKRSNW